MPVVHTPDAVVHELHGAVFASYAAPASGSQELCAWRLEVPAGNLGARHTVSKEEVLLVLSGTLQVSLTSGAGPDGAAGSGPAPAAGQTSASAAAGDAVIVPAGSAVQIGNAGPGVATAWVTTSVGLEAILADGSRISPPWVR
jgi:mannose-6-phosphate isomerase-like protein (cupin superfamily)